MVPRRSRWLIAGLVIGTLTWAAYLVGFQRVGASNMGFKQPYTLFGTGSPQSASGTNLIALPYLPPLGVERAHELFIYAGATSVQKHLRDSDTFQIYSFGSGPGFELPPGEALYITLGAGTRTLQCIGSHDPGFEVELLAASSPESRSGTNFYSHPYHGVSATAGELFHEIGSATAIQRLLRDTDTFQVYTFGSTDFTLAPCEGLIVQVAESVSFRPGHY